MGKNESLGDIDDIKDYIDGEIEHWRENPNEYDHAPGAVHALQNIRVSIVGEMYPCERCGKTEPHGHVVD